MDKRHSKPGKARVIAGSRTSAFVKKTKSIAKQSKITDFLPKKNAPEKIINKPINLDDIKFKQLNSNRRELCMVELNTICTLNSKFVCFGHEPNIKLGAPVRLNNRHTKIHSLTGKPRAYIFASSNLHIWPMPSLTNEDVATDLFDTHDPRVGKLLLCSFCWDILDKDIPISSQK